MSLGFGRQREKLLQLCEETFLPAEEPHESVGIVRHQPQVLPGIALREVAAKGVGIAYPQRIERRAPRPVGSSPAEKPVAVSNALR